MLDVAVFLYRMSIYEDAESFVAHVIEARAIEAGLLVYDKSIIGETFLKCVYGT